MEVYHRLNAIAARAGLSISVLEENQFGEWDLTFRTLEAAKSIAVRLGAESVDERLASLRCGVPAAACRARGRDRLGGRALRQRGGGELGDRSGAGGISGSSPVGVDLR